VPASQRRRARHAAAIAPGSSLTVSESGDLVRRDVLVEVEDVLRVIATFEVA
jgi:hypothetical protein